MPVSSLRTSTKDSDPTLCVPPAPLKEMGSAVHSTNLVKPTSNVVTEDTEDDATLPGLTDPASPIMNNGNFELDENVIRALPELGSKVTSITQCGQSFWGPIAKIVVTVPSGKVVAYFLKVFVLEAFGNTMSRGEFESLKAINEASPGYCPKPFAHARYAKQEPETYFLLMEFRDFGNVPAEPRALGKSLADMHKASQSPTGKFGFHIQTCYSHIPQHVDHWDDSWCTVFARHLARFVEHGSEELKWPEWDVVASCTVDKVVPRLLLPLQAEGRTIKPCLCHGDCWDGNTAMDMRTGKAMIFDVCTFYTHNEYDIGNWRAPRHRLSSQAYVDAYKQSYDMSEPVEDWDDRNRLYSLPYNIASACYVPGSDQRPVIYKDMEFLCEKFCPEYLEEKLQELREQQKAAGIAPSEPLEVAVDAIDEDADEEEEEQEEEEEEEEEQGLD